MDNYTTAEQREAFLAEVAQIIEQDKNNPDKKSKVLYFTDTEGQPDANDFVERTKKTYEDLGGQSLSEIINNEIDKNGLPSSENTRFSKKVDVAGLREKSFTQENDNTKTNKPV